MVKFSVYLNRRVFVMKFTMLWFDYHIVLFQNPERRYSNGIISGYQISIAELSSLNPNSSLSTQEPVLHSALLGDAIGLGYDDQDLTEVKRLDLTGRSVFAVLDENLLKTKNYLIHMRAGTKKGLSEAVSQLLIPSWNKGLYLCWDKSFLFHCSRYVHCLTKNYLYF